MPTATWSPTASRTADTTSTPKRIRLSSDGPPYSSSRWLNFGERNWWRRYPCALWISIPSKPPATAFFAQRTWYSIDSAMSRASIARGASMWSGDIDGATATCFDQLPTIIAPLCVSWMNACAPCSCTWLVSCS